MSAFSMTVSFFSALSAYTSTLRSATYTPLLSSNYPIMAPPIYVKGGVWTNVEDQILRAAVSKYGLTQWARVASLLPKKTAKQAKARWNEYLNPTIDRSNWTKEEDEKLLSLAKLLPHQWRSIAPILGRTATQCVERYQKLLDSALKGEDDSDEEIDDLKFTGPGIEAVPALGNAFESLPSRPDLEDMDDDEREMLSEAKARLANTQGKKAKRKERERMLDESKRIALLQKRRELKAAGVNVSLELKNKKRRKEFDYNADIPHEHAPPPGLFDVDQEDEVNTKERQIFQKQVNVKGLSVKEVDDKRKHDDRAKQESKRLRKEILAAAEVFSDLAETQVAKRRRLQLPAPGEQEEVDDIDTRILEKSRELLSTSDSYVEKGSERVQTLQFVKKEPKFGPTESSRPSRKQLTSIIHKAFAALPKPQNNASVVLPKLDENEDQLILSVSADSGDALSENLRILQQVDVEKEKLRRSQVVQRGLEIPNPRHILPIKELKGVERQIALEFGALVKSDYTEFEDPSAGYEVLNTIDEDVYEEVRRRIEKETSTSGGNGALKKADVKFLLPEGPEIATKINDALDRLDESAEGAESTLNDDFAAYEAEVRAKLFKLQQSYVDCAEMDVESRLVLNAGANEQIAIEMRSARLHELVELVTAAEQRSLREI